MPRELAEREVQRYYQPWLAAHGSSLNVAKHVESIAQLDLVRSGWQPRTSRDKALTAFAQLLANRLGVRRTIISLIDPTTQYILCEATRTSPITSTTSNKEDDDKDNLWLGSAIIQRSEAICEACFVNTCRAPEADGNIYATKGLIVNDCREDERYKHLDYVVRDPGVRFYAGVPLYSRNGYMLGACAVSDESPRDGLTADELRLMQDTAQSVMEHLEWARDRVDRFKGERIVRGMASFIEDCATVRDASASIESNQVTQSHQISPVSARAEQGVQTTPLARPRMATQKSARRVPRTSSRSRGEDQMSRMFLRAADILRDSTLADGAAIFGATASTDKKAKLIVTPAGFDGTVDGSFRTSTEAQPSPQTNSDFEKHETTASDSDSAPAARPCRTLAFSIADEHARCEIENGTALTLGTLERYFSLFPQGRAFSFTEDGAGVSSEDESASDREPPSAPPGEGSNTNERASQRKRRMDHRELLHKIPGAKNVIFLPLYDNAEERLIAGCFLWTSETGRMIGLDADLSYLRAFGNCIVSEVIRMNMQRNEAAKTTFIASMSHELRSPLHGILGAAEFLTDTATDAYQSGLLTSIVTCGRTLLDTLNHVLDYSKINKLGRTQMRRHAKRNKAINLTSDTSMESLNMVAEVDLGVLVEEVAEAVTAGHSFKRPSAGNIGGKTQRTASRSEQSKGDEDEVASATTGQLSDVHGHVCVLLDISPRRSWFVRIQPGSLRRIIMNLLGNALKYTSTGFVAISLRAQEDPKSHKVKCLIRVVDSGKGMSESFQRDRAFLPFSQEDPFQPGTGLGLSIVKQIVDSLGGSIDLTSQKDVGTEIDIRLSLTPAGDSPVRPPDQEMIEIAERTEGLHLVLLDVTPPGQVRGPDHHISRLEQTLREICTNWFGMKVTTSSDMEVADADLYLFCEPPPIEALLERHADTKGLSRRSVPIILVCMNDEDAMSISRDQSATLKKLGKIVEVIPQPCGPRKLAKVFSHCLRRAEEVVAEIVLLIFLAGEPTPEATQASLPQTPPIEEPAKSLGKSVSSAVSYPWPKPLDPATPSLRSSLEEQVLLPVSKKDNHGTASDFRPESNDVSKMPSRANSPEPSFHILLVDDNKINRQLLVMFMEKNKFSYLEAENGQEALDIYKEACAVPGTVEVDSSKATHARPTSTLHNSLLSRRFDFVLMDISMPVMDGMESTRRIREFEQEYGLEKTKVIALTGLASAQAQTDAASVGIDLFLPKPVKFAELRKLLTDES
ncbi:hypothetical protein DOTSEDRAFT_180642 [Dothistroma septosporum NZE10]|uniref:histidine kinase n=1 Tax=Dothistroma septosporum (strain NZE10 / CBS 128990) TaxID=675120 RepID=M2YIL6_DOTSN|nr:hypothetical protein DOTSEDRAFT_180642 [Dothistroma septosporum NZE10]